jgi:hypothetical protein
LSAWMQYSYPLSLLYLMVAWFHLTLILPRKAWSHPISIWLPWWHKLQKLNILSRSYFAGSRPRISHVHMQTIVAKQAPSKFLNKVRTEALSLYNWLQLFPWFNPWRISWTTPNHIIYIFRFTDNT